MRNPNAKEVAAIKPLMDKVLLLEAEIGEVRATLSNAITQLRVRCGVPTEVLIDESGIWVKPTVDINGQPSGSLPFLGKKGKRKK